MGPIQFTFIDIQFTNCFHEFRHEIFQCIVLPNFNPSSLFFLDPQRWIYGQYGLFFPSIEYCSEIALFNLLRSLNALDASLNSLLNGVINVFMFHQKCFLNWQKQKTRYKQKTQISHNWLPKVAILYDKLDSWVLF